jgi:hypothetical protein
MLFFLCWFRWLNVAGTGCGTREKEGSVKPSAYGVDGAVGSRQPGIPATVEQAFFRVPKMEIWKNLSSFPTWKPVETCSRTRATVPRSQDFGAMDIFPPPWGGLEHPHANRSLAMIRLRANPALSHRLSGKTGDFGTVAVAGGLHALQ